MQGCVRALRSPKSSTCRRRRGRVQCALNLITVTFSSAFLAVLATADDLSSEPHDVDAQRSEAFSAEDPQRLALEEHRRVVVTRDRGRVDKFLAQIDQQNRSVV